jgi:hypothetical protein
MSPEASDLCHEEENGRENQGRHVPDLVVFEQVVACEKKNWEPPKNVERIDRKDVFSYYSRDFFTEAIGSA